MHPLGLFALAALMLGAAAEAQETPDSCAGLAPDSFEASVLGCGGAADRAAPPSVIDVLGEAPPPGAPMAAGGLRQAEGDVPELAQGSRGQATLRVVQGPMEPSVLPSAVTTLAAEAGGAAAAVLQVPVGQRPPAGLCRVWFPDRHAGLQRPPTDCDVEVPDGGVLIRG